MIITGQLIDIHHREIYPARVTTNDRIIEKIDRIEKCPDQFIMPGLVDAHIHIESSMVTPGSFAVAAVSRGTTAVVSDPHEIANVLGTAGVIYMMEDSEKVPLKFFFGAPSCVPATKFETSGAVIDSKSIEKLLEMKKIKFLAEMMNYPGVINGDPEILRKIESAKKYNKPIDGHAPGVSGEKLVKYISAGITSDHECSTLTEAEEKIRLGMKVIIREGSSARNLNNLKDLFNSHPGMVMLCSDDLHPEMLMKRHINKLVAQLIDENYDLFDVIRSCTLNPAMHYGLDAGLLRPGEPADLIVVDDYRKMNILETWINGEKVFEKGEVLFNYSGAEPVNNFHCSEIKKSDLVVPRKSAKMRVIEAFDGNLLTKELIIDLENSAIINPDTSTDILKIIVKNRYKDVPPAVGFIKGFNLKAGAFASSIAHDSHNIICIGTNDEDIVSAVNRVISMKGGLSVVIGNSTDSLQLNIAGIMSDQPVSKVAAQYELLSDKVRSAGCGMAAPFMTLSFMALLVIPELKLSDMGLFDGNRFCHVPLFME